MYDLNYIRSKGFEEILKKLNKKCVEIIGICGGFQMLGKEIVDKFGAESKMTFAEGFGFLDVKTDFKKELKSFLPISHQMILKDFKKVLITEIKRYL